MSYDKVIGYVDVSDINPAKLDAKLKIACDIMGRFYPLPQARKLLVAGCGSGEEAVGLAKMLNIEVVGVDATLIAEASPAPGVRTLPMDLTKMQLPDESFDIVYSYHVLEHIPDAVSALKEIHRTMRPGGILYVGFPNKHRVFGYLGHHNNVGIQHVVMWNLRDYKDRLLGRFENKYGAHAGYSDREFRSMATPLFRSVTSVRDQYMLLKYARHTGLMGFFIQTGLDELVFPSNYYVCLK